MRSAQAPGDHPKGAGRARAWSPSPLVKGSFWLHGLALAGTVLHPAVWPLSAAAVALDHFALTGAGLWPRSRLLGPNWTLLPEACVARREVALTIDDGPDPEVTPEVLNVLDQFDVRATFFCIGEMVRRRASLAREIVDRGHTIENHTQHHSHRFSFSGPGGFRDEVMAAQRSIADVTGHLPEYFRAPAGLRNPFLEPVLCEAGLQLVSWTRRGFDTVRREASQVTARLLKNLDAGDILLLHDGNAARTQNGVPVILEVLPGLLRALQARGLGAVTLPRVG